jgi:23S rRNA (adenine2503-C2)-methyltransferase
MLTKHVLPTGYLLVGDYDKGPLETLSIGDYGKHANIKANFLQYTNDISGVDNRPTMPLSEKWVVTLSTQHGCIQKCKFCDVPNVPWKGNVTLNELRKQLVNALQCFPEIKYTERLNIHFARMGEPIFNDAVFQFARELYQFKRHLPIRVEVVHPVLTTSAPKNFDKFDSRVLEWCDIKNELYNGQAGMQWSINSTDDNQRDEMFAGGSKSLLDLATLAAKLPHPVGRKYCLNFALADNYIVDADKLTDLFDKDKFMVKITPIHNNNSCRSNGIATTGGYDSFYPYRKIEQALLDKGWDVLVFVPSLDEEQGLVTCGNAVLGGSKLVVQPKLNIQGINRDK